MARRVPEKAQQPATSLPAILSRFYDAARPLSMRQRNDQQRHALAISAAATALRAYWSAIQRPYAEAWRIHPCPVATDAALPRETAAYLLEAGQVAATLEPLATGYYLGEIYTRLLPSDLRSRLGVFFTPPALARRLITLATDAGVDWKTAKVLDPACGGGAFLAPAALNIAELMRGNRAARIVEHITTHLRGFEIDPFSAWMSQVLLEATLHDLCRKADRRLSNLVNVCDALDQLPDSGATVDLVIGNPPFGRLPISGERRATYSRSIYGHANVYGLFMDHALRWTRTDGVIAFITPTGFLGGEYFSKLRALMLAEASPVALEFVTSRRGVFAGVQQETLLATYSRSSSPNKGASVSVLTLSSVAEVSIARAGTFEPPRSSTDPWLIPRNTEQVALVRRLKEMTHRLADYGYKVSTGPLVWNRHKPQLFDRRTRGGVPVVWSESVTSAGEFEYRVEKRNHKRFLRPNDAQEWLLQRTGGVLVQRTTAKEQRRRLLAAELPDDFVASYGAVSVENHLNIIRPSNGKAPTSSRKAIAALLNSPTVDHAFRCISGSVAVSASELEFLPLPSPPDMAKLEEMLARNCTPDELHAFIEATYMRGTGGAGE